MSVKIACDVEEYILSIMLEKALMWPACGKEESVEWSGGVEEWSDHGGRDHVLTISENEHYV